MTVTITIVADHKGVSKPSVVGDEYVVDVLANITSYTPLGETISAANLGLTTITAATITGQEMGVGATGYVASIGLDASGDYTSSSSFKVLATDLDGTNAEAGATDDVGMIRLRVWGRIQVI